MSRHLTLSCLAGLILGCGPSPKMEADAGPKSLPPNDAIRVVLLGDDSRTDLFSTLAITCGGEVSTDPGASTFSKNVNGVRFEVTNIKSNKLTDKLKYCLTADLSVICCDARRGPMPVHREHIILTRQLDFGSIQVVLTHSDEIDDVELLELEELELRDLLSKYDFNGDDVPVGYDATSALRQVKLKGPQALLGSFARSPKRVAATPGRKVVSARAEVYALTELEAHPLKPADIATGPHEILLSEVGLTSQATLESNLEPGNVGPLQLKFESATALYEGQRFSVIVDEHIAAIGVVTRLW